MLSGFNNNFPVRFESDYNHRLEGKEAWSLQTHLICLALDWLWAQQIIDEICWKESVKMFLESQTFIQGEETDESSDKLKKWKSSLPRRPDRMWSNVPRVPGFRPLFQRAHLPLDTACEHLLPSRCISTAQWTAGLRARGLRGDAPPRISSSTNICFRLVHFLFFFGYAPRFWPPASD